MVIDLFRTSITEVFEQHLGMKLSPCRNFPMQNGYKAQIPFSNRDENSFLATVWIQKSTLKKVSKILLFENEPDEKTLKDLTAELANFIVGHAKMLASDRNLSYKIETPEFIGIGPLQKKSHTLLYKIGNRCIALQIKEQNG